MDLALAKRLVASPPFDEELLLLLPLLLPLLPFP
jgi:hypothetical protein